MLKAISLNQPCFRKISDVDRDEWITVRILVIDKCSSCSKVWLESLDKLLRHLRSEPSKPYGDVHIDFIRDFYQLVPLNGDVLFSKHCIHRYQLINTLVLFKSNHIFVDNPQ